MLPVCVLAFRSFPTPASVPFAENDRIYDIKYYSTLFSLHSEELVLFFEPFVFYSGISARSTFCQQS